MLPALELDESDELSPAPCGVVMVTPSSDSLTLLGDCGTVPPASSNGIKGGILLRDGAREGAAGVGRVDGYGGGVRCWLISLALSIARLITASLLSA